MIMHATNSSDDDYLKVFGKKKNAESKVENDDGVLEVGEDGVDIS